jgi:ABC-type transporter MlaC component
MKILVVLLMSLTSNSLMAADVPATETANSKPVESRSLSNTGPSNSDTAYAGSKIVFVTQNPKPRSATEFIINNIVKVEKLLADMKTDAKSVSVKDPEIKRVVSSVLDLTLLGREALSTHWEELGKTPAGKKQRGRYEELFHSLVEENYLQKIRHYIGGGHHIHFTAENPSKTGVKVMARIMKADVDVIVEFDVVQDKNDWRVVDTKLDDTSLEETYRSSFNRIIRKNGGVKKGFPELLKVMDKRLAELKKGKATQL